VRSLAAVVFACLCASSSWAQQQERGLIDRLLRPDMDLQNNAQGKKFATNSVATERRGSVGTFFLEPKTSPKEFQDTRVARTKEYSSGSLNIGSTATSSVQNRRANVPEPVGISTVREVRNARDTNRSVDSHSFANQRTFREQGKSQRSLDRQNPPLTIEQVRELLNKNK